MVNGWENHVAGPKGFVGSDGICRGGIFDASSGKRWASANFKVSASEIVPLKKMLGGGATAATINGEKFIAIRMLPDKNLMHMRSPNKEPMTVMFVKTAGKEACLVGVGAAGASAGDIAKGMGRVADKLAKA
ncbi:unnamed protein product [Oikopleura dioica]|uniref:Profilin n=1 Tax=Oikopleura dioica TaxID=34765 RepID=E4YTN3_OIKDI|nr:unnamed protein product [Oikopleura dioica]